MSNHAKPTNTNTAMDKIVDESFGHVERALEALVKSISLRSPVPLTQVQDLRTADRELYSSLAERMSCAVSGRFCTNLPTSH